MFVERTVLTAKEVDVLGEMVNQKDQNHTDFTVDDISRVRNLGNRRTIVNTLRRLANEGLVRNFVSESRQRYSLTSVGTAAFQGKEQNLFMENRTLPLVQKVSWLVVCMATILVVPSTAFIVFVARKLLIANYRENTLTDMYKAVQTPQSTTDIFQPQSEQIQKEGFKKTQMND